VKKRCLNMWFQGLSFCNLHRCQDWTQRKVGLFRKNSGFQQDGAVGLVFSVDFILTPPERIAVFCHGSVHMYCFPFLSLLDFFGALCCGQ